MRFTLLISDLHLCETRPDITALFLTWLKSTAVKADALYILGDFFEYWAGDDAVNEVFHAPIVIALKELVHQGVPIYLMHGNRDFLIGQRFVKSIGASLLADPTLVTLYGESVLLSHGDAQCTDDKDYMAFRSQVRHQDWQTQFLNQPLSNRQAFIAQARARSEQEKSVKQMQIMDVNTQSVEHLLRNYGYPRVFIHGHTHRPKQHILLVDHHRCERWVLGDWYTQGSSIQYFEDGTLSLNVIKQ